MAELKPCPFCGEVPKIRHFQYASLLACLNVKCEVNPRVGKEHPFNKLGEAEKWLTEVWNRRANDERSD